jgi:DNA-binding NarL/FixJ family response regulator
MHAGAGTMTANDLLMVGGKLGWAERLGQELARLDGLELFHVATPSEAAQLVTPDGPALVMVALESTDDPAALDELVEVCAVAEHHRPVVVVSDEYHEAKAAALFRLGVTDYLSERDHFDQLVSVTSRLTGAVEVGGAPSSRRTPARGFQIELMRGVLPIG